MKSVFVVSWALCALASNGQTVMYGFEGPQLTPGQTTPLLNIIPDIGPGTFLASFTVPGGGGSLIISSGHINPAFSGQILVDPLAPADTLRVTVSTPIRDVQFDFALMSFNGYLQLQSAAGTINAPAVGQSGSLVFHGASSFTQFDLLGFTSGNTRTLLAIDNLYMTIPEPAIGSLMVAGLVGVWRCRRKRSLQTFARGAG